MIAPVVVVHQPTEKDGWLDFEIRRNDVTLKVRVMGDGYMTMDLTDKGVVYGENIDLVEVTRKADWKVSPYHRIKG